MADAAPLRRNVAEAQGSGEEDLRRPDRIYVEQLHVQVERAVEEYHPMLGVRRNRFLCMRTWMLVTDMTLLLFVLWNAVEYDGNESTRAVWTTVRMRVLMMLYLIYSISCSWCIVPLVYGHVLRTIAWALGEVVRTIVVIVFAFWLVRLEWRMGTAAMTAYIVYLVLMISTMNGVVRFTIALSTYVDHGPDVVRIVVGDPSYPRMASVAVPPVHPFPNASPVSVMQASMTEVSFQHSAPRERLGVHPQWNPFDMSECSVCLDALHHRPVVMMDSCFHVFHQECAQRWFDSRRPDGMRMICPVCRKAVLRQWRQAPEPVQASASV